jgi:hypothetical protein
MPRRVEFTKNVYRWGDWAKARSIFNGLAFKLQSAAERGIKEEAHDAVKRIRKNIYEQRYPHLPLSEWQTREKEDAGHDPRILIQEGSYVKAIRAMHLGRGSYGVGIASGDSTNLGKGLLHEWGGTNNLGKYVPPRPIYRTELERIKSGGLKPLRKHLNDVLAGKRYLASSGNRLVGVDDLSELIGE